MKETRTTRSRLPAKLIVRRSTEPMKIVSPFFAVVSVKDQHD